MRELAGRARQWAAEGRAGVLARPLTERGFGPRRPADALLIDADGRCHGTLYRGAFDRRLADEAAALTASGHGARVCAVFVHDDEVRQARLTCGGQAEILLQPLSAVPARWWELLAEGADAALLTRLDATRTDAVSTVADASSEDPAAAQAHALLHRHRAGRELLPAGDGAVLIETCPAVPHLVIVGAGELADLLQAQARLLDWHATATEDLPRARELLAARPAAACLIVLSHDPGVDVPVLHDALTIGVPYVGALGSRHTQERRTSALLAAGLDGERLRDIHGPIGLDLGARTPAETALAICAEVLGVLAERQP
ncbi:xanthine dehydrogenase [Streptomyces sp. Ru71]|uniref:XdhC family protein n=1 Tax=Streptomyces sp. Ru71 TaxID=2080746 RepID=UPI000CDD3669|nr:XdhC/CoxI family protein [Streptomyces sp. Ru71]POX50122.1 xanthine dehydrogenase [Streptomyces sp. Ru71]